VLDLAQAQLADQMQRHPEQIATFNHIATLIEEVRRCWTPEDYRILQQRLGEHIERVDTLAEEASTRRKRGEEQQRRFPYQKNLRDPNAATKLTQDYQRAAFEQKLYARLGRQYRMVGDAMAWQLYEYEALPLYALGMNQGPGPVSRSKELGADAEQAAVEQFWQEHSAFALRHDYTNCLRIWDLSVFFPDGTRAIQEVKAKKSVSSSQKRKGRMVVELTTHHESTLPQGDLLVHQSYLAPVPAHNDMPTTLDLLEQALIQANQESIGFAANTYLAVAILDATNVARRPLEQLIQEWVQKTEGLIPSDIWPLHSVDVLRSNSEQRVQYPCFGAPYTVYPLPPRVVARIVTGYLYIHYQLNTAAITQAFRDRGFDAECLLGLWRQQGGKPPKKPPAHYFRLRRDAMTINISRLTLEQITFEGLRLEDFVDSIVALTEKQKSLTGSSKSQHFLQVPTYTDMEQIWRSSRQIITLSATETSGAEEHS